MNRVLLTLPLSLLLVLLAAAVNPPRVESGTASKATDSALEKVEPQAAGDPTAWIKVGNALMQKSRESTDSTLIDQAETAYERALALNPKNPEALVGMAWVHNSRHEFPEGMRWAREAIAAGARDHMPYSLLGDAEMELGNYDEALEHFQAGLDHTPNLSTYSRAAHILWLTGNATQARLLMQKAIDVGGPYPENAAWCRAELALMLFNSGTLLPAEQQIDLALKQAPENYHVLYVAGRIKTGRKQYPEAIELLEKSVAQNHGHSGHDAMVALGDLYALTGKKEQAEKTYQQVIALHAAHSHSHSHDGGAPHVHGPDDGNAQLARFLADHDRDLREAMRQAELAYRTYKNVFTTTTLAWCYYKNNRYEDAQKTIRKALEFRTPDAAIFFRAGMISAKLGNRVAAQKQLYKALNLNPNFHPTEATVASETLKSLSSQNSDSKPLANTAK